MIKAEPTDTGVLLEFMFRLGQAYLACGEQTAEVELLLRRVALAYGMGRTRVVVRCPRRSSSPCTTGRASA